MKSSSSLAFVFLPAFLAGFAWSGCSSETDEHPGGLLVATGTSGSAANTTGATSTGGAGGAGSIAGSSSSGGAAGATASPEGGSAGGAGPSMVDAGDHPRDIRNVAPTTGCGQDTGQDAGVTVPGTIQTMGTKSTDCADSKCGAWSYEREYFVTLPLGYSNTKPYPLVFQGAGCGSDGTSVSLLGNNVDNSVIRVSIRPPPNEIGHATNPNQGCFDDKEGDDSVDWVLYENLWDRLAAQLCFDQNRVFAHGLGSGAQVANELGCKYAGDPVHPIRGIIPDSGGLPNQPEYKPTCTRQPMAGMWVHAVGNVTYPFANAVDAIDRALQVNACTPAGVRYENVQYDDFPIGTSGAAICHKLRGCPELYPLVVCPLPGDGRGSHDSVVNPGASAFIRLFSEGNLIVR